MSVLLRDPCCLVGLAVLGIAGVSWAVGKVQRAAEARRVRRALAEPARQGEDRRSA
jgi:hypothetical protein